VRVYKRVLQSTLGSLWRLPLCIQRRYVPVSPHTQRGPPHRLSRVQFGMEEDWTPKGHQLMVCTCVQTCVAKYLRVSVAAAVLHPAPVRVSPHFQRDPPHHRSRVRFGMEEDLTPKGHQRLVCACLQTCVAKYLRVSVTVVVLHLVTVPVSPHSQRGPLHHLSRVRLGLEEDWEPKGHLWLGFAHTRV
jgi:hypothetical protein